MKKILLAGLFAAVITSGLAHAFETFTIKDIRIEGIQRTEAGTVFSYLPVKVGDSMNDEKATQAIKALFATGFFKDVRMEIEGDVLVIVLEERPAIYTIDFIGLKEFDKDQLKKALRDNGIAEGRIFDRATLERAEQELKRQYLTRGKYGVTITTTITPLERNRVGINFDVAEGDTASIKQINIVGASAFKDKDLIDVFQLRTPNWISWYTKNDQYSRQKLAADLESLRSYYLNRGFLEFNIESTQVSISPDKKDIYITISIVEGDRYSVSSIKLAGDLLLSEDQLRKAVQIKPGDIFSREKLNESVKDISEKLGGEGYAFANVNAAPEIDKERRQVAFTIFIDPGKRVYVRRINVVGNTKTRDEVIRQEMRQIEGAWYDADKVKLSKQRVDKTNYFGEVNVETPPVPGTTDQVDVNVAVVEKNTGSVSLGAGFGSAEGFVISGSVSQANLFGSGKFASLAVNTGKINRTIAFSYTNPYFTVDGISQGFDIYHRTVDPTNANNSLAYYKSESTGGGVRWGFPIGEKESLSMGPSIDYTKLTVNSTSAPQYIDFVNKYGDANTTVLGTIGWASDGRDSVLWPTQGTFKRAGLEVATPLGDLQFYKATYQYLRYFPLTKDFTLSIAGEVGYGGGYGGDELPFYKNFYAGGTGSLRGYETGSLGPRVTDVYGNETRIGGHKKFASSVELLFPVPGFGHSKAARLGPFIDAAQIWGDYGSGQDEGPIRVTMGLSALWVSPMGPLKFSVGTPLNKQDGDKLQAFQFQMGQTF